MANKVMPITFVKNILFAAECGPDGGFYRHDLTPGAAMFLNSATRKDAALEYVCPCGCGRIGAVDINTGEKQDRRWLWDGNREKPTLKPSILRIGGCGWHGYLTAGEWITL